MTPQITGFVTRANAKLRPPRSVSRNITPARGGVAVHYGGPAQKITSHAQCVARWRAWQTFHMHDRGWVDIAYTGGFCQHGYAFAGRGIGVRTAANGTDAGNQSYYAVTWIGGDGETPTTEALSALAWWVQELRQHGAGMRVRPHRSFKGTGCPGSHLVTAAARLDRQPLHAPAPPATPALVQEDTLYAVVSDPANGGDYGTNGVVKFPFESQEAKNDWAKAFKAERLTLSLPAFDAIPTVERAQ